jgi:DNA-binding LytR/AlgR family response regulator
MYHIAICDDNMDFLEAMKTTIEENPEFENNMTCYKFSSGIELLKSEIEKFNLIIMDMKMEEMDGFVTAKKIREKNGDAVLAFCSGVVMPQPEHFEVQPYRYLIKTVDRDKMKYSVSELLHEMKCRKKNTDIEIVSDGRARRINTDDIIYLYRLKRGSVFVVVNNENGCNSSFEEIYSNEKLTDWYEQLSADGFEFAHTSYIVNMKQITGIIKDDIVMSNGETLRISRTCKQKFHKRFSCYFSKKYRRDAEI